MTFHQKLKAAKINQERAKRIKPPKWLFLFNASLYRRRMKLSRRLIERSAFMRLSMICDLMAFSAKVVEDFKRTCGGKPIGFLSGGFHSARVDGGEFVLKIGNSGEHLQLFD